MKLRSGAISRQLCNRPEDRRFFVDLLCGLPEDLVPDRVGFWEPLREEFGCPAPQGWVDRWEDGSDLHWKRRGKAFAGTCFSGGVYPRLIQLGGLSVSSKRERLPAAMQMVRQTMLGLDGLFGYVHSVIEPDHVRGVRSRTLMIQNVRGGPALLVAAIHLQRYLPDVYWGTVFGAPYLEMFGRERVLSAPVAKVEEWGEGLVYLQLTETLEDFVADPEGSERRRQAVKEHLGPEAFFDLERGEEGEYRVPELRLVSET